MILYDHYNYSYLSKTLNYLYTNYKNPISIRMLPLGNFRYSFIYINDSAIGLFNYKTYKVQYFYDIDLYYRQLIEAMVYELNLSGIEHKLKTKCFVNKDDGELIVTVDHIQITSYTLVKSFLFRNDIIKKKYSVDFEIRDDIIIHPISSHAKYDWFTIKPYGVDGYSIIYSQSTAIALFYYKTKKVYYMYNNVIMTTQLVEQIIIHLGNLIFNKEHSFRNKYFTHTGDRRIADLYHSIIENGDKVMEDEITIEWGGIK